MQAPYTDPKALIRYHNAEIYSEVIKTLSPRCDALALTASNCLHFTTVLYRRTWLCVDDKP